MGNARGRRQRRGINREPVVLARDDDASAIEVLNRMVRTVMAELHLDGFRAAGKSEQLVPETNSEHGYPGIVQFLDGAYCVITGFGIARTVRQEFPIGFEREHGFRWRLRWNYRDPTAVRRKLAQYIALDAEIVGDDVIACI